MTKINLNTKIQLDIKGNPTPEILQGAIDVINDVLNASFPDMQPQIMSFELEPDENDSIETNMSKYLSGGIEEEEYPAIIAALKREVVENPLGLVDDVEYEVGGETTFIDMWDKVEYKFTVKDFCKEIGIDIALEMVKAIIERKKAGQDCTEEESAELKQFVKWNLAEMKTTEIRDTIAEISKLFTVEYTEALEELDKNGL